MKIKLIILNEGGGGGCVGEGVGAFKLSFQTKMFPIYRGIVASDIIIIILQSEARFTSIKARPRSFGLRAEVG